MKISNLLVTLSLIYSMVAQADTFKKDSAARLFSMRGAVKIQSTDGKTRDAKMGEHLNPGDSILTQKGSVAKLLLADDSVIDLGPDSHFKINSFEKSANGHGDRKVDLALEQGTARSVIREKIGPKGLWHLKTKSAVMGVRGTEFVVNANAGDQRVTVLEGSVAVADVRSVAGLGASFQPGSSSLPQDTQLVTPGQAMQMNNMDAGRGIASTGNHSSGVQMLTSTQMAQTIDGAVVKDSTFTQQVTVQSSSDGTGKSSVGASTMTSIADVSTLAAQAIDVKASIADAPPVVPIVKEGMMSQAAGSMLATSPFMGGGASVQIQITISQ